jgi:hypothetical protein
MLQAIENPQRDFDAVVIGDTQTALTAVQYEDLLWICTRHGVQLWVPEIDEPVEPDNDAHQEIMKYLFWGPPPWFRNDFPDIAVGDASTPFESSDRVDTA